MRTALDVEDNVRYVKRYMATSKNSLATRRKCWLETHDYLEEGEESGGRAVKMPASRWAVTEWPESAQRA